MQKTRYSPEAVNEMDMTRDRRETYFVTNLENGKRLT